MPAAVTPAGVRDGDPAALAGLCALRGPSVLAYCRHVAGDAVAGDAAADAFASFRAAVLATSDLAELDPEMLLISATRSAAAGHAERARLGVCAVVPLLLAARADKAISAADRELLEQHLDSCWGCRAPVERFKAAERAYLDPPDRLMDPAIIAAMIAAMAAARPAAGAEPPPATTNGSGHVAAAAEAAEAVPAAQPSAGPAGRAAAGAVPAAQPPAGAAVDQPTTALQAADFLEPRPAAAPAALQAAQSRGRRRRRREQRERPASRAATGARIPRVRRSPAARAAPARAGVLAGSGAGARSRSARGPRPRWPLPLPIVLPVAVVLGAVLVALFVSGVFGGADPQSSPRIAVPADDPAQASPTEVVVVPGAKEAGPDEVESAKARERARARRKRQAAAARKDATTAPPAAAAPAAVTAPPPAAARVPPPPPPAPPAAPRDEGGGARKVDAGNSATGAEQIPPAEDTSSVPDLAPPPEPATAP